MAGKRGRTWRVDFSRDTEAAARTAARAQPQPLRQRVVRDGYHTYYVVDANALLEQQSGEDPARPGHPNG